MASTTATSSIKDTGVAAAVPGSLGANNKMNITAPSSISTSPHQLQPTNPTLLVAPSVTPKTINSTTVLPFQPQPSNHTNVSSNVISPSDTRNSAAASDLISTSTDNNNNTDNADDMEDAPRRSNRERTSTLIYVDGHAIKKDNNYVMKGLTYEYGVVQGTDQPPVPQQRKQRSDAGTHRPREVSLSEQQRLKRKEEIATRIQSKQTARNAFLKEHAQVIQPFVESRVYESIIKNGDESTTATTSRSNNPSIMDTTDPTCAAGNATIDIQQPKCILATMRSYQLEALKWMSTMYSKNLGFILGDEMGLGKTLQTISLICRLKEELGATGPSLIVVPLSVLYSWCNEITKWAPSLKYHRLHLSNTEKMQPPDLMEFDMVITTYEMIKVPVLRHFWSRQQFNLVALDEGHRIKNIESQISHAVRSIHCENRVVLTGTPLANNLCELYALLNFLAPDVFTTVTPFAEAYDLTTNVVDHGKLDQAHKLLNLFMIRRLKSLVEKKMPKKIETKVICPLSNSQIWWYKALLLKDLNLLAGEKAKGPGALSNLIMQLRKCCNHPYLFPFAEDTNTEKSLTELVGESGKLSVLDLLLRSLYKKGHRVCLFSQFTSTLDIIEDYSRLRGWSYCRFDGGTARAERNYVVNSFNADNAEKFLFLLTTRSGGMGLNLQTADTVILFDSDWNPQADLQAEARVHRIGQTKTVFVYRLVTANTVEERIAERAEKKLYLDRMVMRNGEVEPGKDADMDDPTQDVGKLMSTLKFGCQAVFGDKAQQQQKLLSAEDIEMLTDRSRTENFTGGNIRGGTDYTVEGFDATKEFTSTTNFGGIDFAKIREEYKKKRRPKDLGHIQDMWRKRHRKNRIKMVEAKGSGYGAKVVPVLTTNDYDLATGERSVFQQELGGREHSQIERAKPLKGGVDFQWQNACQVCGDGGSLLCCPRCPVAVHAACAGVKDDKDFMCCSHHHCNTCGKKNAECGGWMFRCSCCAAAYCEDHLPPQARVLDRCEQMEDLGYKIKHGVYIHCSQTCENVAIHDFGWIAPDKKGNAPCPPPIDVSSFFNGKIDDSVDAPEDLILNTKRRRKEVNYSSPGKEEKPNPVPNPIAGPNLELNCATSLGTVSTVTGNEGCDSASDHSDEDEWKPSARRISADGTARRISSDGAVQNGQVKHRKSSSKKHGSSKQPPHHHMMPVVPKIEITYLARVPVTTEGLKIHICELAGEVAFYKYIDQNDGSGPCLAETQGVFRNPGDRILAVNGARTTGKSFDEVMDLMKSAKNSGFPAVTLLMEDVRAWRHSQAL